MADNVLVELGLSALGNVIADTVVAGSRAIHKRLKPDEERAALRAVVVQASADAFSAARQRETDAEDEWLDDVAAQWAPAFTADVVAQLMAVIVEPSDESRRRFGEVIREALEGAGCDLGTLERTISVDEFAHEFPAALWRELKLAALTQAELRDLVQLLFAQRTEHRASGHAPAGPRDYQRDLAAYLQAVLTEAREALPEFLTPGRAANLDQRVRVRVESRMSDRNTDSGDERTDRTYQPPVEFAGLPAAAADQQQPWEELRESAHRIVVLADPGLGKSWLVRTETIRLALVALDSIDEGRTAVLPVPLRAEQLTTVGGRSLGEVVVQHLAGSLPDRSRQQFAEQVDAGHVHLLVDGLDEVPNEADRQAVRAALVNWSRRPGVRRWIVTSRIAGYTGAIMRESTKVELLSLTDDQVCAYVRAWALPAAAEGQLLAALKDPAVSGMARIPLLLAMLCSLSGDLSGGEEIPRTRTALYERVLRWFLRRPHRAPHSDDHEAWLELIAGVAFHFANRDSGWADLMPRSELVRAVRAQPTFTELGASPDRLVEQLSVDLGLLVPEGDTAAGRRPRFLFVHRTFAEYLVARHLAGLAEDRRWAIVERHLWFDPEWLQVIAMLGGLLEPADVRELVERLLEVEDDAFRQAWLMTIRVVSEHSPSGDLLDPQSLHAGLTSALGHPSLRWSVVTALTGIPVLAPAVVRTLLRLTESGDAEVRIAAISSLARADKPDPVAHLVVCLHDEHDRVAAEAAASLTGRTSQAAVDALVSEAMSEQSLVARDCVRALVALPRDRRVQAIEPYLRTECTAAAFTILKGAGPVALPLILGGLEAEDPEVFVAAAEAVDGPLDPLVEEVLLRRLSEDDAVAQAACATLGRSGSQDPIFVEAYLRQVIDVSENSSPWRQETGPTAPTAALIGELVARLGGSAGVPRRKAAQVLSVLRPDGIDSALGQLLDSGDPKVIEAALEVAVGRNDHELFDRVTGLLDHPSGAVRQRALRLVIERDPQNLDELLLMGLEDPDARVRLLAAEACVGRVDSRIVPALLERLRLPDEHLSVVVAVIDALKDRDEPGVRAALLACLHRESDGPGFAPMHLGPPIHVAAARALVKDEPEAVLTAVKAHARPEDGYVGREDAAVLTRCRAPGALDLLLNIKREGWRKAGIAASNALRSRPFPEDLVTIVDRLGDFQPRAQRDLLNVSYALAVQHYRTLPEIDRSRVRAGLTTALQRLA
ncbi:HEAT repeat domain-containing protein [Paractinoplanes hotanensis]|uniref:HEAT repeat domain-containing protein n=1 Tax=Paractinoplanes hotanensis TaxID=2906497 RepID=A0ABT0Y073_9ACTN|nr:HEAT repeat domain-containing protein [Actinoplanes hotanensis]MCM4079265.1 HEAT repeat domain-containing protein [Actinoplanes hotanensis]